MDSIAFQARARTVDHLGREQIADCPTAVSELWKNSYDAYARAVHLHIFDGDVCSAALSDDGHGMSRADFVEKWLVLGTESKAGGMEVEVSERLGLQRRPRQGQKGIGRLSAAALGPLMLLLTKKADAGFVASLIDWRLFQNPFLLLNDIKIPVVEFAIQSELFEHLSGMFDRLMGNIWGDLDDEPRTIRLNDAWKKFESLERSEGRESTKAAIENILIKTSITERQLELWPVWRGERRHGTIMVVADIAFDLKAQLDAGHAAADAAAIASARARLRSTLASFTDPYSGELRGQQQVAAASTSIPASIPILDFTYGVTAWEGMLNRTVVADVREFGAENLGALEHVVDGWVDIAGVFRGRIKIFGNWLSEEIAISPESAIGARKDSRVGCFALRLGTFEQELKNTTHEPSVHAELLDRSSAAAGFFVFRDGLRVLPYGREDNDFFEIERRRGLHAGREFWAIRRMFGRIAIARDENPNLKDKAGREGFIDNKAAKVFRDLIENILKVTARRYFGSESISRKETLPVLQASFAQMKAVESQKKLAVKKRKDFRRNLAAYEPEIGRIKDELEAIAESARTDSFPSDERGLMELRKSVEILRERQGELSLGGAPTTLGSLESSYRIFKSNMSRASELVTQLRDSISIAIDKVKPKSQDEVAHSELSRNAAYLHSRIRKWATECKTIMGEEAQRIASLTDERNKEYHRRTLPLLAELQFGSISLSAALKKLDTEKEILDLENEQIFGNYLSVFRSLAADIDIESLLSVTVAENIVHRAEIQRLNALAQLGITVEIVGHELAGFEGAIREGLKELPADAKNTRAFEAIKHGHESLSQRLQFLSPLKLSGERSGQWINGAELSQFVCSILDSAIRSAGVEVVSTEEFNKLRVFDQFSRLAPVFVNLVNNAIYWAARSGEVSKKVVLDAKEGNAYVSDNGPGVESEDIGSLFTLFFTRKLRGGRGVGLYLCRANLAAGGHSIKYIVDSTQKKLPGANFAIKFSTWDGK